MNAVKCILLLYRYRVKFSYNELLKNVYRLPIIPAYITFSAV